MITKNVGSPDRIIRIVAGLGLGYMAYSSSGGAAAILGVASALALITGLVGWCGLYTLLGINNCKIDKP
jgi:hypothetical protein